MGGQRFKCYAVASGRVPGIYKTWNEARVQVEGWAGARYKGHGSVREAEEWMRANATGGRSRYAGGERSNRERRPQKTQRQKNVESPEGSVIIYTDGGCINNPGPGGYGVVVIDGEKRYEMSGGYRLTTNNRMELKACIEGLRSLQGSEAVLLHSDSKYVVDGITKGWAKRWRQRGWMRNAEEPALNADLWAELLELCERRRVTFKWVKGHAGNRENERCDRLAGNAARKGELPPDREYERSLGGDVVKSKGRR